jgi:hypothetical protein
MWHGALSCWKRCIWHWFVIIHGIRLVSNSWVYLTLSRVPEIRTNGPVWFAQIAPQNIILRENFDVRFMGRFPFGCHCLSLHLWARSYFRLKRLLTSNPSSDISYTSWCVVVCGSLWGSEHGPKSSSYSPFPWGIGELFSVQLRYFFDDMTHKQLL